jgi:hypothetical protein
MAGNWTAPNPVAGAVFTYNLKQDLPADTKLVLTIADESNRQVRRIELDKSPGVKRVAWNLRPDPAAPPPAPAAGSPGAADGQRGGLAGPVPGGFTGGQRGGAAAMVPAGRYTATLGKMVGDKVTPVGPAQVFRVVTIQQ